MPHVIMFYTIVYPRWNKTTKIKWHFTEHFSRQSIFFGRRKGFVELVNIRIRQSSAIRVICNFLRAKRPRPPEIELIIVNEPRVLARSRLRLFTSCKGHRVHIAEAAEHCYIGARLPMKQITFTSVR